MKYFNYFFALLCCSFLFSCDEDEEGVTCPDNFTLSTTNVTNATCEAENGTISLSASGAQGTVSYRLDGGSSQSDNTFTDLAPATYEISAEDAEGCTTSLTVTVGNEEVEINAQASTTASECGQAEGTLMVEANGGTSPYAYSLDGENFQSDNAFEELEASEYVVTVQDANGCTTELTASVDTEISFSARISDIISTNCAVSGCHVAGTGLPNFTEKQTILNRAAAIKSRTGSGTMPPPSSGGSLSNEQIEAIACWVDSGAPDN
ncbi:hypothetical protein OKW21_004001 [Catalinimonas alkaloidigena]|uniref:hypothetical protein n=1 Tax=Catalinimonas alkaloidigena TaxID=1075417 RepID=UPI00240603EB|nr:hypothetical protein [Catalinimonas alkaloidigena]MDF9798738.1 hypothetical protein [Catalinimonas alkaloidigena]